MRTINMLSSAHKVKGQGVSSAYFEQVALVEKGLGHVYKIYHSSPRFCDIMHYHTIDFKHYLLAPFASLHGTNVGYVHFLPETVEGSLELPAIARKPFYSYIIWFYKSMDYLVAVNPYFIKRLATYGIDVDRMTFIPNFVSKDQFYRVDQAEKRKLREKHGISQDAFVVLGVGQVQTRKGIIDFVEVARKMPHIQFLWAGGFSFGSITAGYKELKQVVDNPPENVKFLGIMNREEMNGIYNASDMMFLPSFKELFPMTVLESFNCGIPILLRDLDIYPDVFFDLYLKGNTTDEFCKEIQQISTDQNSLKYWQQQSLKGQSFYNETYVLKLWKDFYDRVYNESIRKTVRRHIREKESI